MEPAVTPFLSCIVTAYNEGPLAAIALQSLLAQSFGDFEILVVDDGASPETRATLHGFDDPRIRHIRQANDGVSSARNRALAAARGEYICFLDADDTRPTWAFAEMARMARASGADCVFMPGLLCELRQEIYPFYDRGIFDQLVLHGLSHGVAGTPDFARALPLLVAIEPQPANKLVRRAFIERHRLRFPSGLFFEDIVFHNAVVMNLGSYATVDLPCFTYFRRYGRPQTTSAVGIIRFDAISSVANTLELFEHSAHFQNAVMRLTVLAAAFKLLRWCEESVSHHLHWQYGQALRAMVSSLNPRYRHLPDGQHRQIAGEVAPWVGPALGYFERIAKECV